MTDAFDRLKAALQDRYTIRRELGSGGMLNLSLNSGATQHTLGRCLLWTPALLLASVHAISAQVRTDESLESRIDGYMAAYVAGGNFAGAILIAQDGNIVARRTYGLADPEAGIPNTPETRFHIASLSKPITAMGVMLLVDDGVLGIDDPVARYVPDFPGGERITIHHLLTHTSGLPDINRFPEYGALSTIPQTTESLVRVIASHADGAGATDRYQYSNSNYNLLAFIIERLSGKKFGEYLTDRIFVPLRMTATAHSGTSRDISAAPPAIGQIPVGVADIEPAPYLDWSVKTGNGSIVSRAEDLVVFLRSLVHEPLLSDASLRLMLAAHVNNYVGYGWFVRERAGRRVFYYNGNTPGVSGYFALYPDEDLCVVVLANHDIPLATSVGRDLAAAVFGENYDVPAPLEPTPFSAQESGFEYVGSYEFSPGYGFDISVEGDALIARIAWPRYSATLIPVGRDRFFHRYYWNTIVFVRQPAGEIESLHWTSSPESLARRTR